MFALLEFAIAIVMILQLSETIAPLIARSTFDTSDTNLASIDGRTCIATRRIERDEPLALASLPPPPPIVDAPPLSSSMPLAESQLALLLRAAPAQVVPSTTSLSPHSQPPPPPPKLIVEAPKMAIERVQKDCINYEGKS